jgi:hypothetical protein
MDEIFLIQDKLMQKEGVERKLEEYKNKFE